MGNPKQTARGFNRFSGLAQGILRWAGARRSGNAASIPPNMFRDLENVRFEGQDIVCRGGQVKYNPDTVLEGCIDGFIPPEYEPPTYAERLLICAQNTVEYPGNAGLYAFESGPSPVIESAFGQRNYISYIAGSGAGGSGGTLYESGVALYDPDTGDEFGGINLFALSASDVYTLTDNHLAQPTTSSVVRGVGQVTKLGSVVYYAHYEAIPGNIVVYQGPIETASADRTVASDTDGTEPICPWSVLYDSKLTLPILDSRLDIRTSGGVWSTVAMPAGGIIFRRHPAGGGVTLGSNLYFTGYIAAGATSAVFKYNGTAISLVHSIDGAYENLCLVAHNGALWFGLDDGAGNTLLSKSVDGTTWVNGFSLSFDATNSALTPVLRQLISFRGKLWAVMTDFMAYAEFPEEQWYEAWAEDNRFYSATVQQLL